MTNSVNIEYSFNTTRQKHVAKIEILDSKGIPIRKRTAYKYNTNETDLRKSVKKFINKHKVHTPIKEPKPGEVYLTKDKTEYLVASRIDGYDLVNLSMGSIETPIDLVEYLNEMECLLIGEMKGHIFLRS